MILVVADKYGITQANTGEEITIYDIYKALYIALHKNLKCDLIVWNDSNMSQVLFTTARTRTCDGLDLQIVDICDLLDFLSCPESFIVKLKQLKTKS